MGRKGNRPLQELFPDDEYARMLPFMQQALAGQLQRFERTEHRAGGLHYLLSIYIPHEQGEQVLGFLWLTQDITHTASNWRSSWGNMPCSML